MNSLVLRNYPHQKYKVIFNQQSGFFIRIEEKGEKEPFWAESGAELLDISITNWCDKECDFCYRGSNLNGKHISIEDYEKILKYASSNNVLQVALGGGNPNQHPEFRTILQITREKYDIVPSYTTNGRGLTPEILSDTKRFCGAVAVSAYSPYKDFKLAVENLLSYDIKTNIHFLLDSQSIETAINWLKSGNDFLNQCNAIIFLNYKPVGKNKSDKKLLKNSPLLEHFFNCVENYNETLKIGFDSCMVSGILTHLKHVNIDSLEPCEAGRFSAFISEDLKMYPCSFMIEHFDGEDLNNKDYMDIWLNSPLFKSTRSSLADKHCSTCSHQSNCLNGCPFLKEINLCK